MIELKNLSKYYDDKLVLEDINLELPAGRTSIILGQSGCGKSTILKLILGLTRPNSGNILIEGKSLDYDEIDSFRKKVGYVIQEGGLFPHLTAFENISLLPDYIKMEREETRSRVRDLCKFTKFPFESIDNYPNELSGGQRQRVGIMRALVLDPDILLLDEPLGSLDPIIRYNLQKDLKEIFTKLDKTVVMVTHDINEASYLGDKIVLVNEGRIVQQGSFDSLSKNPAEKFVSDFINAQLNRNE